MAAKLTPWFPGSVKPARGGVYEREWGAHTGYALWNGVWFMSCRTPEIAVYQYVVSSEQRRPWRGLASDPSKA
jgi:hypothetical protein